MLGKPKHLLEVHGVAAVLTRFPRVCTLTKLAVDDTNIRVIDMPVDVVVGEISVQALSYVVRQTAQSDNVIHAIQFDALI